jgi:predicted TIM-barrel fold metal-dependent hydrolase
MPADRALPQLKAPPQSCDCHLHVFGDPVTYPYSTGRRNTPPALPLAEYLADYRDFASRCGIERMVFTQPSTYGRDNTCLLDAIKMCEGKARGIVDIDEHAPDAVLARLAAAGVVACASTLARLTGRAKRACWKNILRVSTGSMRAARKSAGRSTSCRPVG